MKSDNPNSMHHDRLDQIIPPEILNDGLFHAIRRIASQDDVFTALEIGSSDGSGSTKAFLSGFSDKTDVARLFCMEVSEGRFQKLRKSVRALPHVQCINASSVSVKRFPSADDIATFYRQHQSVLNSYPLSQVLQWLQDDKAYASGRKKDGDGIQKIKSQYGIDAFDMVLIDGSEFTGREELADVYGAKYLLLDDIRAYKNHHNYHRLCSDANYELIEEDPALRNGYAVFKKVQDKPSIHFFTIVLNGRPFIRYHWKVFRQLPFEWHWHIIEGVADLKHDTAWSVVNGGRIDADFHHNGLSVDGTGAYLDQMASRDPQHVTIYRKPKGEFWDGKREMVSAPMANLPDHCLLWQVDADEIWKADQIRKAYDLFERHPEKTAAFFHCHFFVGPGLVTTTPGAYSHNNAYEWIRVWRYRKGMQWKSHEPPCLMANMDGQWIDTAAMKPFTHKETEAAGLVFTHHAYSLEDQVRFKESYYGYPNAVDNWRKLQMAEKLPLRLRDYLPWVQDHCNADHMDRPTIGKGVAPVRLDEIMDNHKNHAQEGHGLRIVIDGVIFQLQAKKPQGISRVWTNLLAELFRQMPSAKITVLQREGFPVPGGIADIHKVPAYQWSRDALQDHDDEMLRNVCRDLKADLFFSTYYTRAPGVANLVMIHDMIPEKFGIDLTQPEWMAKQRAIETADAFICVSQTTQADLVEAYPQVAQRPMIVVHNGLDPSFKIQSKLSVEKLKNDLNFHDPYVLMVGNRHGYKNAEGALKALAQLPSADKPAVLCVGGETQLSPTEVHLKDRLDIRYAGTLDDLSLAAAYGGALALLVPSKYEGFGLPVIEAMACGCPVIALDSPAVVEIGADAVCYADLCSVDNLSQAFEKITEISHRQDYIEKGHVRAAKFNWRSSCRKLADFIQSRQDEPSILLTAIVSTYNAAQFIEGCLEDLEKQTIADQLEIIVIDSASDEDEAAIVKDFQRRFANIKYIRTPKREKVYQAWNRGIKFALGKYITNANTDDRHRHDAYECMVGVMESNDDIALVYADVIKTRTANETFRDCTPAGMCRWYDWDRGTLLEKGCFIGPQPVWRKDLHQEYGFFDENYDVSADFEFWLRISQTNTFYHIPKPLGLYLDRPDSIEHANVSKKQNEDHEILQRYRQAAKEKRVIGLSAEDNDHCPSDLHQPQQDCLEAIPESGSFEKSTNEALMQGGHTMYSPETIFKAIEHLVDNGLKESALWAMGKLLDDFPDNARLHNEMAALAHDQADTQKALLHFKKAAALEPQNGVYQKNLADYYYVVEKDAESALTQYETVLTIDPRNIESLIMAGHVSISLHRYRQGRQYYQRALDLDPNNTEIIQIIEKMNHPALDQKNNSMSVDDLYAAAETKVQEGDRQTAISLLEQLLARDDNHALAHNDLGVLQYESGHLQDALAHYEKAAGLQPENDTFQKNLADFYLAVIGDRERALRAYVQVLKLAPRDVEAMLSCGQICMSFGKEDDAMDFINTALEIEPWNENAQSMQRQLKQASKPSAANAMEWYESAKSKASEGDLHGAINDLSRYIAAVPDNANAHNDLGVLYFETGDKDKALASYEQAVQLEPNDHTYLKNLADFYLVEQGRTEEAMKLYLRVLEADPQDIESLIGSGMVCATLNQVEDAKLFYNRVIEIEPWNEIARNALNDLNPNGEGNHTESAPSAAAG